MTHFPSSGVLLFEMRILWEILLCESLCESCLGPRPGEIWAFVRNIRTILKGFEAHGANFKSDECLEFWPHEPHQAQSLRRKNFGPTSFSSYILFRDSKHAPSDASNFVGSRKISFIQNERVGSRAVIKTTTQKYKKAVAQSWRNFPCLTLWAGMIAEENPALRVTLQIMLGPPARGNLSICAQYSCNFEGFRAPWGKFQKWQLSRILASWAPSGSEFAT